MKILTRITCASLVLSGLWASCATANKLPAAGVAQSAPVSSISTSGATASQPADRISPPTAPSGGYFGTLPPGSTLPSDATCAAAVRQAPELREVNTTANQTKGVPGPTTGIYTRVTGNFTGTTDELIQWASCKWGLDEDMVRAQVAKESWWHQDSKGDLTSDASRCAPGHGIGVDGFAGQCPESFGLLQIRYPYWQPAFPSAIASSAYNLDYSLAARRNCFEGNEGWLNNYERGRDYAGGDLWGCMGLWFSGRWYAGGAVEYIAAVQQYLADRVWESGDFRGG